MICHVMLGFAEAVYWKIGVATRHIPDSHTCLHISTMHVVVEVVSFHLYTHEGFSQPPVLYGPKPLEPVHRCTSWMSRLVGYTGYSISNCVHFMHSTQQSTAGNRAI